MNHLELRRKFVFCMNEMRRFMCLRKQTAFMCVTVQVGFAPSFSAPLCVCFFVFCFFVFL